MTRGVVRLAALKSLRPPARSCRRSTHGGYRIHEPVHLGNVVLVSASQRDRERAAFCGRRNAMFTTLPPEAVSKPRQI